MFCSTCGNEISNDANVCSKCGAVINESGMMENVQPVQDHQQPVQGYQQPMQGYQQPVQGYQQPMQGYQQPMQGYQQPMQGGYNKMGEYYQKARQGMHDARHVVDVALDNVFNLWAFIFGEIWLLTKGLYDIAIATFVIDFFVYSIVQTDWLNLFPYYVIFRLGTGIFFGKNGNYYARIKREMNIGFFKAVRDPELRKI